MRRFTVASLALAITLVSAAAIAAPIPCTVASVSQDIYDSLVGEVGVSSLDIRWVTNDEGADLTHYEVWLRSADRSERLALFNPRGMCGADVEYTVQVAVVPDGMYVVEVHSAELVFHSIVLRRYITNGPTGRSR